ncbi:DUF4135 domain-containing protein [Micromonospora luteifusca]|uniref:DUF4135 domain-containing protein n=1 Tax=Micromonospora luteifusca TaxID=709860 RepID=UPI0033BD6AF3
MLARELLDCLRRWIETRLEFAERLLTDLPELRHRFGVSAGGLGDLVDVGFGAEDSHRGGRSVAVVTFSGGSTSVRGP